MSSVLSTIRHQDPRFLLRLSPFLRLGPIDAPLLGACSPLPLIVAINAPLAGPALEAGEGIDFFCC